MSERQSLAPGMMVLIGVPGITLPNEWWLATVKWADCSLVLVEQTDISRASPHKVLFPIDHVRAIGTIAELLDARDLAIKALAPSLRRLKDAERKLEAARTTFYCDLDKLAEANTTLMRGGAS